jgi:hypothetical protein
MRRRAAFVAVAALLLGPAHAQVQRYTPGTFDGIEIAGAADVRYEQAATEEVTIEGAEGEGDKRPPFVVRDGVLRVDPPGSWRFWNSKRMQIVVRSRALRRIGISGAAVLTAPGPVRSERLSIAISGSGLARFEQLDVERLDFAASGAGDAEVAGRATELVIGITGRSDFRGADLQSRRAKVAISGLGDVVLWATEDLSIAVSGVGHVDYWGSPNVRRAVSGSANINARGDKPERK